MDFWEILNAKLDESGLDDQNFAEHVLGINRSTFSRIKRGSDPSFPILVQIANGLGLEVLAEPPVPEMQELPRSKGRQARPATVSEVRALMSLLPNITEDDVNRIMHDVENTLSLRRKESEPRRDGDGVG